MPRRNKGADGRDLFNLWDLSQYYNLKISEIESQEVIEEIDLASIENYKLKIKALESIRYDLTQINSYGSPLQKDFLKLHDEFETIVLNNLMDELNHLK